MAEGDRGGKGEPVAPIGDEASDEWRTPEETARLRDEAFARLMKLPPKPQRDMKLGKPRRGAPTAASRPQPAGESRSEST
jgi:hypothetical protein